MSVTTYEVGLDGLDALTGVDALCLFVAEDDRPLPGTAGYVDWRLCGALSRVLKQGFFTGVKSDWLLLPSDGRLPVPRIFAVGLGARKNLDAGALGAALANAAQVLEKAKVESVALELPGNGKVDEAAQSQALQQHFLPGFKGKRVTILADKGLAKLLPVRKS
ncbi:M17 family peptidase N-terminal domain-containing protein [Hyalangium versicolor]|uniref:M17 family peptidase N-terminal domain-containing protein n=1 Tax=Hyalangium versicolor TaxID=2861190 RepID=UPI001CCC4DEB|nr:M17 family peptidase N-terminal domain-containing protein [Hyalangium versicolor]